MSLSATLWRWHDAALDVFTLRAFRRPPPPETFVPRGRAAAHVIIVSVDGLRPEALRPDVAPEMAALAARGVYCATARTVRPSITRMAHGAMLTGLDFRRTWGRHKRDVIPDETVFSLAKRAGLSTALFASKGKLFFVARPGSLDFSYGPDRPVEDPQDYATAFIPAEALMRLFAKEWARRKYDLVFFHLGEPDLAGHAHTWMSAEYLAAVTETDRAVGLLRETLRASGDLAQTALIVTTDHGGSEVGNTTDRPENMTIPWLCAGPGVPAGVRLERVVRVYDTAPTALALLGLRPPPELWGRVVQEVFGPRSEDLCAGLCR